MAVVKIEKTQPVSDVFFGPPSPILPSLYTHYDPTSIKFKSKYDWDAAETGSVYSPPSLKSVKPTVMTLELRFDDYKFDKKVQSSNTASSLATLKDFAHPTSETDAPIVKLLFGTFYFYGVISDIEVEITAYDEKMTPKRANVTLEITRYYSSAEDMKSPDSI
jgi:hypothetical protein